MSPVAWGDIFTSPLRGDRIMELRQAFYEELTNDAPAAGSEGGADSEFFFAGGGASEKQIGDVAAADEEQEAYGGEDDVQGGTELADDQVGERFNVNAEFLRVVLGVHSGKILGDDSEVGFGLADGDARREVTEQEPELRESILGLRGGAAGFRGNPHIGIAPAEARRHDSDQGALCAIEDKGFVDEIGIGAEAANPGLVAHDEDGRRAGLVVSGLGDSAEVGGHAEEFKCAGADEAAIEALCPFAGTIEDVEAVVGDYPVKDMILCDIVEVFGAGEASAAAGLVLLGIVDLDGDQAAGIRVGKGLHQDVFDDAEDGGGGADAEGEGYRSDYGKGWAFAQVAEGEANVLAERTHQVPPG